MDPSKCYLFLNAQDSFLDKAEKKLKSIEGLERAKPDIESKIIMFIDDEERERMKASAQYSGSLDELHKCWGFVKRRDL